MDNLKHILKWNYYYNHIGKSVSWGYNLPDTHVSDFMNYYSYGIDNNALDVGCGYGKNSTIFLSKGVSYTGIDISKTAIVDAKNNYKEGEFICSDFLKYNFYEKLYDFIIDAGCIHVNHPSLLPLFLDKYYFLLKKGGKLFIRVFKCDIDSNNPLFFVDNILPVWGYTEGRFKSYIDDKKFSTDLIILDKEYYDEDEIFYFYLTKK